MKHDMPDYVRDMDRDGKVDGKDHALFHEMLNEDQRAGERGHAAPGCGSSEPWTISHSIAKGLLLLLFGGFLLLLFKGVFPVNGFTAFLALGSAVAFLRTLML